MIEQDSIPFRNPDMILRKIGGEFMLVPIYQENSQNQIIFALNEVAGCIWELIENKRSVKEIIEILQKEFNVERIQLQRDTLKFLNTLEEIGGINHGMP